MQLTRRLVNTSQKNTVIIPKVPTKGSYFGECTCGLDKRDAVPCEHMAAIVVSSRIGVLTRHNIMPFWWKRSQWHEQLPPEVTALSYASMVTPSVTVHHGAHQTQLGVQQRAVRSRSSAGEEEGAEVFDKILPNLQGIRSQNN